ncbi:MAG: gluconokinase [Bacteroidota bacterium]
MPKHNLFVIMGVSGTGKTTIGKLLSEELDLPFFDGDDFHPEANITKMASGKPLNDEDRQEWLVSLHQLLSSKKDNGAIVACSALKKSYRVILKEGIEKDLRFVYLKGSFQEVKSRMEKRKGHFMPMELLKSQFHSLEEPENAIVAPIMGTPDDIVQSVLDQL